MYQNSIIDVSRIEIVNLLQWIHIWWTEKILKSPNDFHIYNIYASKNWEGQQNNDCCIWRSHELWLLNDCFVFQICITNKYIIKKYSKCIYVYKWNPDTSFLALHKLSRVNTKTILGKDLATSLNYGQGHGCPLYSHKLYDYVKHNDSRIMHNFKIK